MIKEIRHLSQNHLIFFRYSLTVLGSPSQVVFGRKNGFGLSVNGVELVEGGTSVKHGALLFLDQLLFVDHDRVEEVRSSHPYLESGPLLPKPWYRSQFLSHAHKILSRMEQYSYMSEYMEQTAELGDHATRYGEIYLISSVTLSELIKCFYRAIGPVRPLRGLHPLRAP